MKFHVIASHQTDEVVDSLLVLSVLPEIKCAWCSQCKYKIFIHPRFPKHPHPLKYPVEVDNITKVCWITQKYKKLLKDDLWMRELKRMNLEPIYHFDSF